MNLEFVEKVAAANVCLTIANIKHRSEILREMEGNNEIAIVGGMYESRLGVSSFINNKCIWTSFGFERCIKHTPSSSLVPS